MNNLAHSLSFPLSLVLAVCTALATMLLYRYGRQGKVVAWMGSTASSRWLLGIGALLLAFEGTWSVPVHSSVAFTAYLVVLLLSLGMQLPKVSTKSACLPDIQAWLSQVGLWLIVAGSLFGAPDRISCKMQLYAGEAGNIAYMGDDETVSLPFTVALDKFETEYYETDVSAPRQFRSHLLTDGRNMVTEVNAPASYQGYDIFQVGGSTDDGGYSVLQLVRDPWLPVVYLGMSLLAVAAVLQSLGRWNIKVMLPVVLAISLVFTMLSIAKINFQTLIPALRSWWFVPHLGMYMVAYALVAIAVVVVIRNQFRYGKTESAGGDSTLAMRLMQSASGLILLGMLMGSVWARQAWGDYWSWDPKENWAAVTWIMTQMCLPDRQACMQETSGRRRQALCIILTFISLQITWYGVNYLPSAVNSMHTYN